MTSVELFPLIPLFHEADVQCIAFGNAVDTTTARQLSETLYEQGLIGIVLDDYVPDPSQRASFWRNDGLDSIIQSQKIYRDGILVVTGQPLELEELIARGIRACLICEEAGDSASESIKRSLQTYITGEITELDPLFRLTDPIHYTLMISRLRSMLSERQFAAKLGSTSSVAKAYKAIANEILGTHRTSFLEPHLKALFIDQLLWNTPESDQTLASMIESLENPPLIPRFLNVERVLRQATAFFDQLLEVVEAGSPIEARSAVVRLLAELESFFQMKESFLREIDIIRPIGEKVRRHIREHHDDYVTRTGVLHEDEWQTLVSVFDESELGLDRRFTEWINETYREERRMAAQHQPADTIRRYVKERLIDDLVLRVMELEMRDRSLHRGLSRISLFPTHHESKNRAMALTQGIDNQKFWEAAMIVETTMLSRWIQSLMARLSLLAKEAGVVLRFRHKSNPERAPRDLVDLSLNERESLDHIVTELLTNAIKYRKRAPDAENKIRVTVTESDRGVEIKIKDKGIGIRDTDAIWNPDTREHPELVDGYGGGLPSVLSHVRRHSWRIEVKSVPDEGTTFTLSIPLKGSSYPPAPDYGESA